MSSVSFAGYAAIFNRIDQGGDVIRPGAFGSLQEGQDLPLLWQHNQNKRIGCVTYAKEDDRGLRVIGYLSKSTSAGCCAAKMLANRKVDGLSFGYHVKRSSGQMPRILLELDVAEISMVTCPMQLAARVHAIA